LGKEGASEALLSQVKNQLKTRELIKVRVQRTILREEETDHLAQRIASATGSTLVEVMGHTFALYKKRENRIEKGKTQTK